MWKIFQRDSRYVCTDGDQEFAFLTLAEAKAWIREREAMSPRFLSGRIANVGVLASGDTRLTSDALREIGRDIHRDTKIPIVLDPDATDGPPELVFIVNHQAGQRHAVLERGCEGTLARPHRMGTPWTQAATQRSYDRLICPWCGDMVDASEVVRVRFDLTNGTDVGMDVCKECSTKQPCRANVTGIHGEIYDGDYDGARPPLPFEPDHQHGWCSRCYLPFVWSVEQQRWVDYPEELTPKGRLARLMDAFEAGHITQDEYDEGLAGLL